MPNYTIFDDGIIEMYTRDECEQRFLTKDELIEALITAGIIQASVIISIPVIALLFVEIYNKVNQYNNTNNRTPDGYYTGKLPNFQSRAIYLTPSTTDNLYDNSPLEIDNIYPEENEESQYLFNNKWLFPKEVIFTYQMYRLKGDDGNDVECCD